MTWKVPEWHPRFTALHPYVRLDCTKQSHIPPMQRDAGSDARHCLSEVHARPKLTIPFHSSPRNKIPVTQQLY